MGQVLKRIRLGVGVAVAITASTWLMPAPATAAAAAWNCNTGSFCVYTGDNGTGSVCAWSGDDPDWNNGTSRCSWSPGTRVQSAFNNGTSGASVSAFTAINNGGTRAFCLPMGGKTNSVGTYLRSHTWTC